MSPDTEISRRLKRKLIKNTIMLTEFLFKGKTVRFVGTQEKPEWVAQDVCECLEIKDTFKAIETFKPTMKGTALIRTLGGNQTVNTVFESGLYKLIFKSRKKVAEEFQDWIFEEVLPEIRRTGSYIGNKTKVMNECSYSHSVKAWETRLRHQVPVFVSIAMLVFDGDAKAMYDILKDIAEKNPSRLDILTIPYEAVVTFFSLKQLGYFDPFSLTHTDDLLLSDAVPKL